MEKGSRKTIDELYKELGSSEKGLTDKEAGARLFKFGLNSFSTRNHFLLLKNIAGQFTDFLVIILIIAGILSMILGDNKTAIVMFGIVAINAFIGFWQQYRTEKTLLVLREMLPQKSSVIRDGQQKEILSRFIVPGDIVILQAGDAVPADGRIVEFYSFKTNEASLTGESSSQTKHVHADDRHPRADSVFMGTNVLEGEAKILVTETGFETEFGSIAKKTKETKEELSPLQKKLRQVGQTVAKIAGSIMVAIILFELAKNQLVDGKAIEVGMLRNIFLFALALAAALVPEGLPATVSVALSLGANRLIKKKAIVKKLASVETLGSTNVICTDKTGTLTNGKMSVVSILPAGEASHNFSDCDLKDDNFIYNWALNHNVKKTEKGISGDADEVALYEALVSKKIDPEKIIAENQKIHEVSFNPIRKMMSVLIENNGEFTLYSKGNPKVILERCELSKETREKYLGEVDILAREGLRVFGFAHKKYLAKPRDYKPAELESDLIFDGFCGILDDIRPEVPKAIEYCHKAGIKIIMITGDYKVTAEATAKKINLAPEGNFRMISGIELKEMADLNLRENLQHPVAFYETDPGEKLRIVETLQKMGQIVAVTGDGVNDALALKKADIGVAMGISGTDVAKEAADMVLLDDNFATIANAVKEGRLIWDNLKKFLFYVFASNAGEFMTVVFGLIFALPTPILAVQILSVDLGTDVFPSIALADDPAEKGILGRPVFKHKDLLSNSILIRLFYVGIVMGGGAALNFWLINGYELAGSEKYMQATAAAFATLVVCQIVNVFEVRGRFSSAKETLFGNKYLSLAVLTEIIILLGIVYWQPLQNLLSTKELSFYQWLPILGVGLAYFIIEQVRKSVTIKNQIIVKTN